MKRTSTFMVVMLVVLLFACMLPMVASAAETPSGSVAIGSFTGGTVTINASNADDSFALYKVVDVSYNSTTNEARYAFTTAAAAYAATCNPVVTIDTYQSWANDSDQLKDFLAGFASYVKTNNTSANYTGTASNKVCIINNVALGQYMILGTGSSTGAYIYQIMTATFKPDNNLNVNTSVAVASKATAPTIVKTVDDSQVAYGDIVTYTLTIGIPTYPRGATCNKTFTVKDVLPTGITYANTSSIKVAPPSGDLANAPTASVNGQTVTWTFDFDDLAAYQTLTITYTATVNDNMAITTGATNTATLTYSDEPFGPGTHDISDDETVYTYGIEVTKVSLADNTTPLVGVEFELYKGSVAPANKIGGTYTTDNNGKIFIKGLDVGTYILKETKTINGYTIVGEGTVSITITDADKDGLVEVSGTEQSDGIVDVTVTNTPSDYTLPQTGGTGTWVFTIVGVGLMLIAAAVLVIYRKRCAK